MAERKILEIAGRKGGLRKDSHAVEPGRKRIVGNKAFVPGFTRLVNRGNDVKNFAIKPFNFLTELVLVPRTPLNNGDTQCSVT